MNYEEANKHALAVRWKTEECGTKDCWCRMIVPESPVIFEHNGTDDEIYVVGAGAISKDYAEHVVKIHNQHVDNTEKNK